MLDNMANLSITFREITIESFKVTVFTYPPAMYKGKSTSFSTSPPTFVISVLFSDSCSVRCEVISQSSFDMYFPDY